MARTVGWLIFLWTVAFGSNAAAATADQAAEYKKEATAAFALGKYADAAEAFENAYKAAPDPALLYNAAQSYRLAGKKERALTLYENYLRVFGVEERRAEVEAHIEALKRAIAHDKEVASSPPTGTDPVGAALAVATQPSGASAGPRSAPPSAAVTAAAPTVLLSQPSGGVADENRPVTKKSWFWVVLGGGVAAAAVVTILLARGGGTSDPTPSLGTVSGYPQ